jgi:hypothetical protein
MSRHSRLVSAAIEAGRLEQAVADCVFALECCDRSHASVVPLTHLTFALAKSVVRSWKTGGAELGELDQPPRGEALPVAAEMKLPEGYAFYAVYPEAFADAAVQLKLSAPARVIGVRSIGTSLAAVVAAALDAPPPISVRPFGDPFDRRVALTPELEAQLLSGDAHYVIVDEGPGLSGSSFGAVADWLEARGVPLNRIAFLTSHSGQPGVYAQERHSQRWPKVQRITGDFGSKLAPLLAQWSTDLLGHLDDEPFEISGGGWRSVLCSGDGEEPPVNPVWERRKFRLRSGGREFVAKFAGLGDEGERKLGLARRLSGFVPEPVAVAHGFIIEEWHDHARPLAPGETPIEEIARYLGARAHALGPGGTGAPLSELLTMAKRNGGLALGGWAEGALDSWLPRLDSLQQRSAAMPIDGRLDRHEWLRLPNGQLLKSDALEHHRGHDLIGCQDLAWDVAGASVEFDLTPEQTRWVAAESGRAAGRLVDPELLDFLTLAYLAFRLGQASISVQMSGSADARRWEQRAAKLIANLGERLSNVEANAPHEVFASD